MEQIFRRVHALSKSDWHLGFKLNMLLKFLLYSCGTKNFIPAETLRQRLNTFLRGQFEELWGYRDFCKPFFSSIPLLPA
jgi:hypothetical protein